VFGRAKELAPESTFQFFVLSEHQISLPRWIRLGKWMAKARVEMKAQDGALTKQGNYRADGALNPLDLAVLPETCNIVAMAPASLITNVQCTGSYYELAYNEDGGLRTVRLPANMHYQPERTKGLLA